MATTVVTAKSSMSWGVQVVPRPIHGLVPTFNSCHNNCNIPCEGPQQFFGDRGSQALQVLLACTFIQKPCHKPLKEKFLILSILWGPLRGCWAHSHN
jgi:hypothetical protein